MLRGGEDVKRNRRWARHWFGKAAAEGVAEARRALAKLDEG